MAAGGFAHYGIDVGTSGFDSVRSTTSPTASTFDSPRFIIVPRYVVSFMISCRDSMPTFSNIGLWNPPKNWRWYHVFNKHAEPTLLPMLDGFRQFIRVVQNRLPIRQKLKNKRRQYVQKLRAS